MKLFDQYIQKIKENKQHSRVIAGIVLTVAIVGIGAFFSLRHNAYAISVDDHIVAIVKDKDEAKTAYETVVENIKKEAGKDIAVNETISVKAVHSKKSEMTASDQVMEKLNHALSYNVAACEIYVDGKPYAIVDNQETASEILEGIAKRYLPESGKLTLAVENMDQKDSDVQEDKKSVEEKKTKEAVQTPVTLNTPVEAKAPEMAKESEATKTPEATETPTATETPALTKDGGEIVQVEEALPQEEVTSKVNVNSIQVKKEAEDDVNGSVKGQKIFKEMQELNFNEEVTIKNVYVEEDKVLNKKEATDILLANTEEKVQYTLVEGDNIWDIAMKHGTTVEDILAINPQIKDETKMQIGDVININVPDPILSISSVEEATYKELIPAKIEYIEFSDLYDGETKVYRKGNDGVKQIKAAINKVNGKEVSREVISEKVLKEANTKVIAYGTKKKPAPKKTAASSGGSTSGAGASASISSSGFIHPLSGGGSVSSGYGSRWGRFHKGIDLAASAGTPIYAAASGKVIYAGYNSGGYGNLVIIDHGNGMQTYYAHCSSVYVNVGQSISQGQNIAGVGSTGDSTGNHLHFEVRSGGTPVNPYGYIF